MKDNIDFLFPISEKSRYLGPRPVAMALAALALIVAACLASTIYVISAISSERREIERLRLVKEFNEKRMSSISSDFKRAQEIDKKFQALQKLIKLSGRIKSKRYPLVDILEDLSLSIPPGVFLTSLKIESGRKPGVHAKLRISGIAASSDMADRFILSLERLPYLLNPRWNQVSFGESDRRLLEFEIVSDVSFKRKG